MKLTLRKSLPEDVPAIMEIIGQAQEYFRCHGIDQWQNGYPNADSILNDINLNHSHVLMDGHEVIATAMISFDGEPTYTQIEGEWLSSSAYAVVHRVAVRNDKKGQNIAGKIIELVEQMCKEKGVGGIRMDTHKENLSMQRLIEKCGLQYCGIIIVSYGAQRLAYEKVLG